MKYRGERPVAADFFVFRTPLLPFDAHATPGVALQAPHAHVRSPDVPDAVDAAIAADRQVGRAALRRLLDMPAVREAIVIASPSLADSIAHWQEQPESERGRKVEVALVKYIARMAGRATPLGLFAGVSTGRVGGPTQLQLAPTSSHRRRTRLDFHFLGALAFHLFHDPQFRRDVIVRPNSSLHRVGPSLRLQALQQQDDTRVFQFLVVDSNPYVDALLMLAATSAQTPRRLAAALCAQHPEITESEASDLVGQMLDIHLLTSELEPPVTGAGALEDLLAQLGQHPGAASLVQRLQTVQSALADLDQAGAGAGDADRYRAIAQPLTDMGVSIDAGKLYHVDLFKPAPDAVLGDAVVRELSRAAALLCRICEPTDPLQEFRDLFAQRYEENAEDVPLQDLLDQELGLFGRGSAGNAEGQLLTDLDLRHAAPDTKTTWTDADRHRLRLLGHALSAGATEIVLTEQDVDAMAVANPLPLPDSFAVHASLSASSAQALRAGDFRVHVMGIDGPSGANLLSRFCYGDPQLESGVRRLLAAEESARPDVLFADIVHLPYVERVGNFMQRPLLRGYEIPYLGRSGAPVECQIPVSDLTVSVQGGRVILRSRKHQRQVLPRLTNAHMFASEQNDRLYRFLCQLPRQGVAAGLRFRWGALQDAPFLPRVVFGKLVLSPSTWNLTHDEIQPLTRLRDGALFRAVQTLRDARKLPRHVLFAATVATDNWLPVDLDNILSIEAWAQLLGSLDRGVLTELFPAPDALCAAGPEGRFTHELVVPFTVDRTAASARTSEGVRAPPHRAACLPRSFAEGTEWLFAKAYVSSTAADDLLRDLAPHFDRLTAAGAMDRFFFVRYSDPFFHLRLRVHGDPARLRTHVLPVLSSGARRYMAQGVGWRFQLDTYQREIERYGGDAGIETCEQIFCADANAVLRIIGDLTGDEPADIRWQLALLGMDRLLDDLGLTLDERISTLSAMAGTFRAEYAGTAQLERGLGKKQRLLGPTVDQFLRTDDVHPTALSPWLPRFQARSAAIRPLGAVLRAQADRGDLTRPLTDIAGSLLHMHVNRMLRTHHRPHEVVLYDLLLRHCRSRKAQRR